MKALIILFITFAVVTAIGVIVYKLEEKAKEKSEKEKNNIVLCFLAVIIAILFGIIFADHLLYYLIPLVCVAILAIIVAFGNRHILGKFLMIALVFSIAVTLVSLRISTAKDTVEKCSHPACAEEGPFPCYGKNNTCPNYTYCYQDRYCDECE